MIETDEHVRDAQLKSGLKKRTILGFQIRLVSSSSSSSRVNARCILNVVGGGGFFSFFCVGLVFWALIYTSHSPSISPNENISFSNENSVFGCAPACVSPKVFLINSSPNPN